MTITRERVLEVLSYSPIDGVFTWIKSQGRCKKGSVAGTNHDQGYLRVCIDGKSYYLHRLVFLIEDGIFPEQVDHIDKHTSNNKRDNLRKTTAAGNRRNSRTPKNSTTGVKGVHLIKKSGKYLVSFYVNGSRKDFGRYQTLEEARTVSEKERKKYHGEFYSRN